MRKKLIGTGLGTIALAALLGGNTFASWSDYAESDPQVAGAGTFELELNAETGPAEAFDDLLLPPGEQTKWIGVITRLGDDTEPNIAGHLYVTIDDYVGTEDGCQGNLTIAPGEVTEINLDPDCQTPGSSPVTDPGGARGQFGEQAIVRVVAYKATLGAGDTMPNCINNLSNATYNLSAVPNTALETAAGAGAYQFFDASSAPVLVQEGDAFCVGATVRLPNSATNASQGDSAGFDLRFDLTQA